MFQIIVVNDFTGFRNNISNNDVDNNGNENVCRIISQKTIGVKLFT